MGFMAQGVDDQHGDILDLLHDGGWHMVAVAEIGSQLPPVACKDVTVDEHFAVRYFGRRNLQVADHERPGHLVRFGADIVPVGVLSVESVVKHPPQLRHGVGRGIDRHRAVG